jgi:hypothetical protein
MRVLVVGGSGEFGVPTVRALAGLDEVDEVVIAARNLESAQAVARECGLKVDAVQVDATDVDALTSAMRGFDFVLNTSSSDTAIPAVRAAIAAGVNYCDILSATTARDQLDAAAREAGITAITGIGLGAGLLNMLYVHLGSKLDEVEELQALIPYMTLALSPRLVEVLETGADAGAICRELLAEHVPYHAADGRTVDAIRFYLSMPWQQPGTSRALGFVGARWQDVDPVRRAGIPAFGLEAPPARPFSVLADSFVMPRHGWPPGAGRAVIYVTGFSHRLNERMAAQADRIAAGGISRRDAASEVRTEVLGDPAGWLLPVSPDQVGFYALGVKDGRPAVASATMPGVLTESNWYMLTAAPLIVAARRVWRGEVEQKGVLLPEAIFSYEDFEPEVLELLPSPPAHGRLVVERMEFLD